MNGSSVNRLKKAGRWEQFANATIRYGIDTAGKAAWVYYDSTNPAAQMGFGIGGNIKAVAKDAGKLLIVAGTDRAVRAIDGSSLSMSDKIMLARLAYTCGGNIKAVAKDAGKPFNCFRN